MGNQTLRQKMADFCCFLRPAIRSGILSYFYEVFRENKKRFYQAAEFQRLCRVMLRLQSVFSAAALIEIDHYGERLIGCVGCNRWGDASTDCEALSSD